VAAQRFFIELSYNGGNYHGWQIQDNAVSVQQVLDKALSTIFRFPVTTTGCGRTDTGVHARQFFTHFDGEESMAHSPWSIVPSAIGHGASSTDHGLFDQEPSTVNYQPLSMDNSAKESIVDSPLSMDNSGETPMDYGPWTMDKNIIRRINSILPPDIAVQRIFPVKNDAHARFDAVQRSYEYHIHFNKDPFKNGYSWQLRNAPDVEVMNQAAKLILQYTDFSCFSKSNTQVKTNNCKITKAEWVRINDGIVFHISADRFLRNMVRAIVGTLLMVGHKEIEPYEVQRIIESKNRSNAGASVPACGLYLTGVVYAPGMLKGELLGG
jgi:tRNA pseudouridine38-40 synthase